MTKTHTPGPWKILPDQINAGRHSLHDNRFIATSDAQWEEGYDSLEAGDLICALRDQPCQQADARLIAAAPELLAMLTEATRIADSGRVMPCDTIRAARAAIAKATL